MTDTNSNEKNAFLLTNKIGGYALISNKASSRYEGIFFRLSDEMFKIVEEIQIKKDANTIEKIEYNKWNCVRTKNGVREQYYLPAGKNVFYYKLNKMQRVDLVLDCRKSYDTRKWGREYKLEKKDDCLVITYSKKNDNREDNSRNGEYTIFLAIHASVLEYFPSEQWIPRKYPYDSERKSMPDQVHAFNACKIKCADFTLAVSFNEKEAIDNAKKTYAMISKLMRADEELTAKKTKTKKGLTGEIKKAYSDSLYSLYSLTVEEEGSYAGLPWFFQYWARDELISLKSIMKVKSQDFIKQRLMHYLKYLSDAKAGAHSGSSLKSIDAYGWLFFRMHEMLSLNSDFFSSNEKGQIKKTIELVISRLKIDNGLVYNGPLETWMDTAFNGDNRAGYRIEIQALVLAMLKLHSQLSKKKHPLIKKISDSVRTKLWNKKFLNDGLEDNTKRPNVFIAAYVYPELLKAEEWGKCFDEILPSLWLDWGGLSSIDTKNSLFVDTYSGEDNASYHRGDSWYWINNLAGLILNRLNSKKYKKYVEAIINAGITEMNKSGAVGHSAEISSASELGSKGCLAQLWSSAMFIELIDSVNS